MGVEFRQNVCYLYNVEFDVLWAVLCVWRRGLCALAVRSVRAEVRLSVIL